MVRGALGNDLSLRSRHFIALRYPARAGGFEWLVIAVRCKPKKTEGGAFLLPGSEQEKQRDFESAQVSCFNVHGARPEEIQLRNTGVVNTEVRSKTVALIGLGALGSKVAELLAQVGVGTFRLCDMDRMNTGNVTRHIGGLTDFGAKKTRVVMTRLFNINPNLQISSILDRSAVSSLDVLSEFMKPADVTISTTADENVESIINQSAVIGKNTVVYGRAMRRGSMGRVFLVRPQRDACKMCLGLCARASGEAEPNHEDWIEVREREEDILLHECGRPVIPASAIDLSFVASLVARVALDVLEQQDSDENHWVWSREAAPDVDARLDKPFATVAGTHTQHADCSACQEPDVVKVLVPDDVRAKIVSEVESSVSVETGGILLGHINEDRIAVVVRATGPGPNAKKSAALFERDVEFVQSELEQTAKEYGKQGLYIGEWHSHLESDPEPSDRDIMSLCGIAEAPNYATRCPVMIIAGLDTETGKVTKFKGWSFPLSSRVCSVEIDYCSARRGDCTDS